MTETTGINSLSSNYVQVIALAQIAEAMFTTRLLEIEPQWQSVLSNHRMEPGCRLLHAIRQAVAGLTCLSGFVEALKELGDKPMRGRDYKRLGAAFIAQLERSAPMAGETRAIWQRVFRMLARTQQSLTPAP